MSFPENHQPTNSSRYPSGPSVFRTHAPHIYIQQQSSAQSSDQRSYIAQRKHGMKANNPPSILPNSLFSLECLLLPFLLNFPLLLLATPLFLTNRPVICFLLLAQPWRLQPQCPGNHAPGHCVGLFRSWPRFSGERRAGRIIRGAVRSLWG